MPLTRSSREAAKRRVLAVALAVAASTAGASAAHACPLPVRVMFRSLLPVGEGGHLFLRGGFTDSFVHVEVTAYGLPAPQAATGTFEVFLSSSSLSEDLDLGALEPDSNGDAALVFDLEQDRRDFALAVDRFSLFDGEDELAGRDVVGGFALRLSGRLRLDSQTGPIFFEMTGKVTRRPDGTLWNEFRGKCRGADVGTYTLRMRGPELDPVDVTLDVATARRLVQSRFTSTDDLLAQALDFDEFAVLEADVELGSVPLLCR
jgi:hypothetical protein